jgi:hypothetical protein
MDENKAIPAQNHPIAGFGGQNATIAPGGRDRGCSWWRAGEARRAKVEA